MKKKIECYLIISILLLGILMMVNVNGIKAGPSREAIVRDSIVTIYSGINGAKQSEKTNWRTIWYKSYCRFLNTTTTEKVQGMFIYSTKKFHYEYR